jgi:hypothetical protein
LAPLPTNQKRHRRSKRQASMRFFDLVPLEASNRRIITGPGSSRHHRLAAVWTACPLMARGRRALRPARIRESWSLSSLETPPQRAHWKLQWTWTQSRFPTSTARNGGRQWRFLRSNATSDKYCAANGSECLPARGRASRWVGDRRVDRCECINARDAFASVQ